MRRPKIITVGISPAWDITCCAEGPRWGDHKQLSAEAIAPAGKALNVSRALAWMGVRNTAAGLWGSDDYPLLKKTLKDPLVRLELSVVSGLTRQNITILDTESNKEMHLRAPSAFASQKSLSALNKKLSSIIHSHDIVVFSGSLPANFQKELFAVFSAVTSKGAKLVLDTSGPMYRNVINSLPLLMIKPNVNELSELIGQPVKNSPADIIRASRPLCRHSQYVLVSRSKKGAILVSKEIAFECKAVLETPVVNTVGCGDFLLAGFLADLANGPKKALTSAIKTATARAAGFYPQTTWRQVETCIAVKIRSL